MTNDQNPVSNAPRKIFGLLELIGTLAIGVGIGLVICDQLLHHAKQTTVGMTLMITTLVFGGAALSRYANKRNHQQAA